MSRNGKITNMYRNMVRNRGNLADLLGDKFETTTTPRTTTRQRSGISIWHFFVDKKKNILGIRDFWFVVDSCLSPLYLPTPAIETRRQQQQLLWVRKTRQIFTWVNRVSTKSICAPVLSLAVHLQETDRQRTNWQPATSNATQIILCVIIHITPTNHPKVTPRLKPGN